MSRIDVDIKVNSEQPKESKYGDDETFESWADINIFFPITNQLVDPLYCMGLTPNMVTIISTIFTFLSIYYLHLGNRYYAFSAYLFGYVLDCVDGRMARKYSMGTDIGMALDCTSDNVSNAALFAYILFNRPMNLTNIGLLSMLSVMSYMLAISFGLNEAIASYELNGSDNFYERRVKQLDGKGYGYEKELYKLFLLINKVSYETYKKYFPTYDKEKINKWLGILKHFGPGNYCLFVGLLLLFI